MKRTILAVTAAALLASATFAVAAPNGPLGRHERPSPEQMAENAAAFSDARIAALKAGLKLTADQEKLWPALETALQDFAKKRIEARKEFWTKRQAMRDAAKPGDAAADKPAADAGAATPAPQADAAPAAGPKRDFVAGLTQRADRMVERGTALKQLADAAAPLYASLDDAQKGRFALLFRAAEGERPAQWRNWRHGPQGHPWQRSGHDADRMHHRPGMPGGDAQRL